MEQTREMNEYLAEVTKKWGIKASDYNTSGFVSDDYTIGALRSRESCCGQYAWAIPNDEAIQAIIKLSPIVEIGAGNGYWAYLIDKLGGDIVAYDKYKPLENTEFHYDKEWFNVQEGGPEKVIEHSDRTLLLVWPPYEGALARQCLKNYTGSTLIYVGEDKGGCTADDEFFDILENDYTQVEDLYIPQWIGIHDCMGIYTKKLWKR